MTWQQALRTVVTATFILLVLSFALSAVAASAHTADEQSDWWADWHQRVQLAGGMTPGLLDEAQKFTQRHEVAPVRPERPSRASGATDGVYRGMGANVEQWRGLVASYGGWNVDTMMAVMACESGGNPNARNPSSGASGLFQVMGFWADHYGVSRSALFDPATNVSIAHKVWLQQGYPAWSAWKRGCR